MHKRAPSFTQTEIRREIRRLIKLHTSPTFKRVDVPSVIRDLAKFESAYEPAAALEARKSLGWASKVFGQYDRQHRPKFIDKNGDLFPCTGLIPIDKNVRVDLVDASDDDLRAWFTIETNQLMRNVTGSQQRLAGLQKLMEAMHEPEYRDCITCGEFWRKKTGWTPPDDDEAAEGEIEPEDIASDDADDDDPEADT